MFLSYASTIALLLCHACFLASLSPLGSSDFCEAETVSYFVPLFSSIVPQDIKYYRKDYWVALKPRTIVSLKSWCWILWIRPSKSQWAPNGFQSTTWSWDLWAPLKDHLCHCSQLFLDPSWANPNRLLHLSSLVDALRMCWSESVMHFTNQNL